MDIAIDPSMMVQPPRFGSHLNETPATECRQSDEQGQVPPFIPCLQRDDQDRDHPPFEQNQAQWQGYAEADLSQQTRWLDCKRLRDSIYSSEDPVRRGHQLEVLHEMEGDYTDRFGFLPNYASPFAFAATMATPSHAAALAEHSAAPLAALSMQTTSPLPASFDPRPPSFTTANTTKHPPQRSFTMAAPMPSSHEPMYPMPGAPFSPTLSMAANPLDSFQCLPTTSRLGEQSHSGLQPAVPHRFTPYANVLQPASSNGSGATLPRGQPEASSSAGASSQPNSPPHKLLKGSWSKEEDQRLCLGNTRHGTYWPSVAKVVRTRTDSQCRKRYYELKSAAKKSPEDALSPDGQVKISVPLAPRDVRSSGAPAYDPRPFKCPNVGCDKDYPDIPGLIYHRKPGKCRFDPNGPADTVIKARKPRKPRAPKPKSFNCPYPDCDKAFDSVSRLSLHQPKCFRNPENPFPYKCPNVGCDKAYRKAAQLHRHRFVGEGCKYREEA